MTARSFTRLIYRLLLWLHPLAFRKQFGDEMLWIFDLSAGQMHMVKDFQAFGGDSPSRLIQKCGDFQPWSIGTPMSLNRVISTEMASSFPGIPNLPSGST